tara:strand:- start:1127 stop:1948 length:822 start_codon:yes stop_codon:yes gene_type:complete
MTNISMPNETVLFDNEDGIATVTLNRPESLNSMNDALMQDISSAMKMVEEDESVRVLVITGAGRGFCSGADLNEAAIVDEGSNGAEVDGEISMEEFFNPALASIKNCPVPTIARVNGVAAGGGLGIALACDLTIAVKSTFFVATFGPRLGIVPDMGSTWSLPMRAGRARAMGMAMLGERIDATQAEEWGLIWKAVDDAQLDIEVANAAAILRNSSPAAMKRIRTSIDNSSLHTFVEQLSIELDHQSVLIPKNMAEGAQAFLEKREPVFNSDRN